MKASDNFEMAMQLDAKPIDGTCYSCRNLSAPCYGECDTATKIAAPPTIPQGVEQAPASDGVPPPSLAENSVLRGPADADNFRVKVGRYGDRWYTDPLPACDIAPESDWRGPSISATKPPFANKYVPMKTIAEMAAAEWHRLADLPVDDRYEAIKANDKSTGQLNMKRGSLIHERAEDLLYGRTAPILPTTYPKAVVAEADKYQAALESFFDTWQPELVAAEVVCLNRTLNGVGYGGTADAFVRVDGAVWLVDWKSRASDHGAYLEEAAQGGGYGRAEYMIVRGPDGQPQRILIPEVAGVLIVSIKTDGFKAYPIDLEPAIRVFDGMHRWWCDQRAFTDSKAIGRPWAPKAAVSPAPPDTTDLRARIAALIDAGHTADMRVRWPEGVPTLSSGHQHTAAELDLLRRAVERVEADHSMPFIQNSEVVQNSKPQVEVEALPVDGKKVPVQQVAALQARVEALRADRMAVVQRLAGEAQAAGLSVSVRQKPVERRYLIASALVAWAESDATEDELLAAAGLISTDDQMTVDLDQTLGALIARFDISQATRLAEPFATPANDAATAA